MKPIIHYSDRLIKSEDLNHHRTLFAGRCAEWFVEAGFIAAASELPADHIVCVKIHGLEFTQPMHSGEIAHFESKIIYVGRSSLKVYVALRRKPNLNPIMTGFITFVHVDDDGTAVSHGLSLELTELEDIELNRRSTEL